MEEVTSRRNAIARVEPQRVTHGGRLGSRSLLAIERPLSLERARLCSPALSCGEKVDDEPLPLPYHASTLSYAANPGSAPAVSVAGVLDMRSGRACRLV